MLKMIGIYTVVIIGIIIIIAILFLNLSPQFGKGPTKEQKIEYTKLGNYKDGRFINKNITIMDPHYWEYFKELFKSSPKRRPVKNIPVNKIDFPSIENSDANISWIIWFGHSTFLLEIEGKKILIDPMFNNKSSPIPLLGPSRYSKELPMEIDDLPFIDVVILSHDHYDHLDYESIRKLKGKVGRYLAPLGIGNHLIAWGIQKDKIKELNWWESAEFDNIKFICTPARHFSGRGLFDRSSTLWCSWIIKGTKHNIYFSGDGGYDAHFKEIGEKYGPFDISLMESGQYHKDWKQFHMFPEEAVQATIDIKSKLLLPIHWGSFTLAFHDWTDPIERILNKANELNVPVTTPKIGEKVLIGGVDFPEEKWWEDYISEN